MQEQQQFIQVHSTTWMAMSDTIIEMLKISRDQLEEEEQTSQHSNDFPPFDDTRLPPPSKNDDKNIPPDKQEEEQEEESDVPGSPEWSSDDEPEIVPSQDFPEPLDPFMKPLGTTTAVQNAPRYCIIIRT